MKEREISIVDLMVQILLHWRMFVVWMIGGAVLFGIFSYMRSDSAAKQQQTQTEAMIMGEPERWFTEEEILNAGYVAGYEKNYLEKEEYLKSSPLMHLDSNHISKAEVTIAVTAEDRQQSCDIAKVYKDIAESGELIERVAEDTGIETLGVSELLHLNRPAEAASGIAGTRTFSISKAWDEETVTFRITTVYDEEAKCQEMLDSAVAFIMEKQQGVENVLGEHEICVINESIGVVSDMEISNLQTALLNDIGDMKKEVSDAKKELTDREQQYYEFLMSDTIKTEEMAASMTVSAPGVSIKYVLLGAVLAAFVYAFILLLKYIFDTKIRATDSMQELYGLPQLGMIPAAIDKKKVLGFVDKWIISIRNHDKRQFSPEEALELTIVAAKMAAGKESLQDVCLLGCGLKEYSLEVCEKIKARLEEEGIRTAILNNVLYDAQMLEDLEDAKGAILVENAGSTLYSEIAEELELLKRQGIKALGGIVVE